jgi:hypothetical protein
LSEEVSCQLSVVSCTAIPNVAAHSPLTTDH